VNIYQFFRPLIFKIEPEKAHNLALNYLKFLPKFSSLLSMPKDYENLNNSLWNLNFLNPIGMSAGFDKNAEIIMPLFNFGFGFVEAGTTTPIAQTGNDQPRIFRLVEDQAIINRLGFNNLGANYFYDNLKKIHRNSSQIIGVNIGKNKDTIDASADYILLLEKFYDHADYITINISSPNTKNLRDLQDESLLNDFLQKISQCKNNLQKISHKNTPILLKIAPDLELEQQKNIAKIVMDNAIDGIIISNTTIARNFNLKNSKSVESGGLSGKPLFEKSNEVLRNFYRLTDGKIPLIGVGGISSAQDAYTKIKNGASLVQIYSAFIYQGFALVEEIKKQLSENLEKDGFKNISEAIGCDIK
jgi:dihydroorotate dehydrogenase